MPPETKEVSLRSGKSPARLELLLWCLLAVTLCIFQYVEFQGPLLGNDSYQYLSVAENARAGKFLCTPLIHFDTERSHNTGCAPLTTFPPGYALAAAAVSFSGWPVETDALLVSCAAFVLLVPILFSLADTFGLTLSAARFLLLVTLANAWALSCAISIGTESLFTALSLGAIALLARCLIRPGSAKPAVWTAAGAGLLMGIAYYVRYAGIFLFAAITLLLIYLVIRRYRAQAAGVGMAMAVGIALVAPLIWRNILLTGSWKGGNTKHVSHPLGETVAMSIRSAAYLYLGPSATLRFAVLEVLCWIAALVLICVALRLWFTRPLWKGWEGLPMAAVLIYIAVYCGGMFYLGLFSVISYGPRMFYPLVPLVALLLAMALSRAEAGWRGLHGWRIFRIALAAGTVIYVGEQIRMEVHPWPPPPHRLVESWLQEPTAEGVSLLSWIEANVPRNAVLLSAAGQATGFVVKRTTVSLIERDFSDTVWDEAEIEKVMNAYGARFLILYPGVNSWSLSVQKESPFVEQILQGKVPAWLSVAARNPAAVVYRRNAPPVEGIR